MTKSYVSESTFRLRFGLIGHSDHSELWGRLLGDTADRVSDHAHCSVLIVKQPENLPATKQRPVNIVNAESDYEQRSKKVSALEILDSRGNPTVSVTVSLSNGITASAGVPSGASTGIREAVELRDGDPKRYGGKGVLKAVANVNKVIAPKLKGKSPHAQKEIDELMCELDGTDTKSKLGANAILGVSMAVCRAAALDAGLPLYEHIRKLFGGKASAPYVLPAPMMNVLNGGRARDQ